MKELVKAIFITSLIILLSSCGGSKEATDPYIGENVITYHKKLIEDNVKDRDRMTQMLKIIDETDELFKNFDEVRKDYGKRSLKILGDYNASDADVITNYINYNDEFNKLVVSIAQKNAEIKTIATSEEWEELTKFKKDDSIYK